MSLTLDIRIRGREYRVACAQEEAGALQAAAELLDARMAEIAAATKGTGERLAVMAALNLAHELNQTRQDATPGATPQAIDDRETRRRINAIEARLDAMLAPQESLF